MPAPKKSMRPRTRPATIEAEGAVNRGNRSAMREAEDYRSLVERKSRGGSVKKMATGGMCRGMGKATKGGNYKMG